MSKDKYDIIVIGAGSGGLSIGLFMNKAGFRVLMISKSDRDIGGDCLNDGCVPSKALIHIASIIHQAKLSGDYGWQVSGKTDFSKVMAYVTSRQDVIRKHENAAWLREQGVAVALGPARFTGKREVEVNGKGYSGDKIVIATGSRPARLSIPGIEWVKCLDNESIFHLKELPGRLLVIGGGPIGIELAQAMNRLGSKVTVVHKGKMILEKEDAGIAEILLNKLAEEGIDFRLNTKIERFVSGDQAIVNKANSEANAGRAGVDPVSAGVDAVSDDDEVPVGYHTNPIGDDTSPAGDDKGLYRMTGNAGSKARPDGNAGDSGKGHLSAKADIDIDNTDLTSIHFDFVFVAVGRELNVAALDPGRAGIKLKEGKIIVNSRLQTSNKNVFVCGDVAGDLKFSHAAEFHARILINNFFSPLRKKLDNRHMSWVTFTDPELATFGMSETELKKRQIRYIRTEQGFDHDDRAVVGNFEYAKLILFLTPKGVFGTQKILGGTMLAPNAGELVQELILANTEGMSVNAIFNKIYPYPVAARINQQLVVRLKESSLTNSVKRLLKIAYRIFG